MESVAKHDDTAQHSEDLPSGGDDRAGEGTKLRDTHEDEELKLINLININWMRNRKGYIMSHSINNIKSLMNKTLLPNSLLQVVPKGWTNDK